MGLVKSTIAATLLATIAVLLVKVVYRVFFHPLARFPGPLLAKISDLHAVYYSIRGESHLKIWRAHRLYGPVVRLGPNKLMFDSVQALHDIYDSKSLKKSVGYTALVTAPGTENTFNAVDKTTYRRKRKIIGPAFSEQAVRSFEPAIMAQLDIFLGQIVAASLNGDCRDWTEPINMSQRCKWLMMDLTGELGFGKSFELQTKQANRGLVKAVINASKTGGVVGQYPRLKYLRMPRFLARINKKPSTFGRITEQYIKNRTNSVKRDHPDLYTVTMGEDGKEEDQKFDLTEMLREARLLVLAGSDTTAAVLAATFFYLSRNRSCYNKLVAQIRNSFVSPHEIKSGPKLTQLTYLRACIDETMRMTPPVGGALGREILSGGTVIDGTYVEGGCDVGVALYCVHHNEDIFPDSFSYRPERWLGDHNSAAQIVLQRRAFNPFSVGPRKCVAQSLAYAELSLAVATTLWLFDIQRPSTELDRVGGGTAGDQSGRSNTDEFQLYEHLTSIHDGPFLQFRYRQDLEEDFDTLI